VLAIDDAVGIGILIGFTTTGIVAIIGAVFAGIAMLRTGHVEVKVDKVQNAVETFNELTVGQLTGRIETRRIDDIDPTDRTDQENRHMAMDVLDPTTKQQTPKE